MIATLFFLILGIFKPGNRLPTSYIGAWGSVVVKALR
jgi:hypothetical protein